MTLSTSELKEIGRKVAEQFFEKEDHIDIEDQTYPIERTSRARLKKVQIDDYIFLEQNMEKDSKWAELAKQGHEIIWIFEDWEYIGRIVDGNITLFY